MGHVDTFSQQRARLEGQLTELRTRAAIDRATNGSVSSQLSVQMDEIQREISAFDQMEEDVNAHDLVYGGVGSS